MAHSRHPVFAFLSSSRANAHSQPKREARAAGERLLRFERLDERLLLSISPTGGEFQVNMYTTGAQVAPKVAMDAAGDSVAVWSSDGQDGSQQGVFAKLYDASGHTLVNEFQVNTYATGEQSAPVVARSATGSFVVAWQSFGQDGDDYGIYAQRYSAAGIAQGSEFRVNAQTSLAQESPTIAMDAAGDFVIAWQSVGQDGSGEGIFAQRYSASGAAQGSEFQVNAYTTMNQQSPAAAMDAAGDFVIVWQSAGQDGDGYGVYAERYSAAGSTAGSEFRVNTLTTGSQTSPTAAMDVAGDFVVAWVDSGSSVQAQRYNASGTAEGTQFQVNATTIAGLPASVAMDSSGDFVVAWEGQDASGAGVLAQYYDPTGTKVGSQFQVNTYTSGNQLAPAVAMDAGGDFIAAWESQGQDGDSGGIYAQRYTTSSLVFDGTPETNSVQVTFLTEIDFQLSINGTKTQVYTVGVNSSLVYNAPAGSYSKLVVSDTWGTYTGTQSLSTTTIVRTNFSPFIFTANGVINLYVYVSTNSTATVNVAGSDPGNYYVYDTKNLDSYIADPTTGVYSELSHFESETVTGANGSTYAYVYSTSKEVINAAPSGTSVEFDSYVTTLGSFAQEYFVGASDGTDTVNVNSAGGQFVATPGFSYVTGTAGGNPFLIGALYVLTVNATAAGSSDTAVFDSYAHDGFQGTVGTSVMSGSTPNVIGNVIYFYIKASNYLNVSVFESGSGTDDARITSPGSGTFVETPTVDTMVVGSTTITVNTYTVSGGAFVAVPAAVGAEGTSSDTANVYDAPGTNTLTAASAGVTLQNSINGYSAGGCGTIIAYQQNGSDDTVVYQQAIDFVLQLVGNWKST